MEDTMMKLFNLAKMMRICGHRRRQTATCHFRVILSRALVYVLIVFGVVLAHVEAKAADGMAAKAIAGGASNSVALMNDGTVWAWGHNAFGESGICSVIGSSHITNLVPLIIWISDAVAVGNHRLDPAHSG